MTKPSNPPSSTDSIALGAPGAIPAFQDALRIRFGANVRRIRVARGLKQRDLAECTRTTQAYVSQIESGSQNFTTETMQQFAKALDVDVADLLITPDSEITLEQVNRFLSWLQTEVEHEKRRGGERLTITTIRRIFSAFTRANHS